MMVLPKNPRIYEIAATMMMVAWLCLGLFSGLLQLSQIWQARESPVLLASQMANILFLGLLIVLFLVRRPPLLKARGWKPRLAGFAGVALPTLILALPKASLSPALAGFAAGLVFLGIIFSIAVAMWLGRAFSVFPQARGLVTDGPYRFVRHPLYVAEMVAIFGGALEFVQPWSMLLMVAVAAVQLMRIHYEEQVLSEVFAAYHDYAAQTARLIPGIY